MKSMIIIIAKFSIDHNMISILLIKSFRKNLFSLFKFIYIDQLIIHETKIDTWHTDSIRNKLKAAHSLDKCSGMFVHILFFWYPTTANQSTNWRFNCNVWIEELELNLIILLFDTKWRDILRWFAVSTAQSPHPMSINIVNLTQWM